MLTLANRLSMKSAASGITMVAYQTGSFAIDTSATDYDILFSLTGGSLQADDLIVIGVGTVGTVNTNMSSYVKVYGTSTTYTQASETYSDDTHDVNSGVFYRFMGGTPDTGFRISTSFHSTGALYGLAYCIMVFRGVDTVTPLDVATTTATGTNSVLADPPSITPTTSGAVIVGWGAGAHARGAGVSYSSSDLSSFISAEYNSASSDAVVGMGIANWTSGAFDPAAFTFSASSGTAYSWGAATLALRPA